MEVSGELSSLESEGSAVISERQLVHRSNKRLARGVCGYVNSTKRRSRRPHLTQVLRRAAIRRTANKKR
jgi:hypothetical protein